MEFKQFDAFSDEISRIPEIFGNSGSPSNFSPKSNVNQNSNRIPQRSKRNLNLDENPNLSKTSYFDVSSEEIARIPEIFGNSESPAIFTLKSNVDRGSDKMSRRKIEGEGTFSSIFLPPVALFLLFLFLSLQIHLPLSNCGSSSTPSLPTTLHMSLSVYQWDLQRLQCSLGHGLSFTTTVPTKLCCSQCTSFATQNSSLSFPSSFYKASDIAMDTKVTHRIRQQPHLIGGDRCWFCYVQIFPLNFKFPLTHSSPSSLLGSPLDFPTIQATRKRPWDPPSPTTTSPISPQALFGFSMDQFKITPVLEFTFTLTSATSSWCKGTKCSSKWTTKRTSLCCKKWYKSNIFIQSSRIFFFFKYH